MMSSSRNLVDSESLFGAPIKSHHCEYDDTVKRNDEFISSILNSAVPKSSTCDDKSSNNNNTFATEIHEYKDLIETISNLQTELETSKSKLSSSTNENESLHNEQKLLETKLMNVQTRFDEMKQSLIQLIDSTSTREKKLNEIESRWRGLVERERKELVYQKNSFMKTVKEVESIRCHIQQEVRGEYDEKFKLLIAERNDWEDKYHEMNRDLEVIQVKSKVTIETITQEIQSVKKARDDEISSLQEALCSHMESTVTSDSQIDQLRMDVAEANTKIEQASLLERELKKSLDNAHSGKKNEERLKTEAISLYEIESKKIRSEIAKKENLVQSIQNEKFHSKKTLETMKEVLKQKCSEINSQKETIVSLTSQLEECNDKSQKEKAELMSDHQQSYSKVHNELKSAKHENTSSIRQKQKMECQLLELRKQMKQIKSESVVVEQTLKREAETKITRTILENNTLTAKNQDLVRKLKLQDININNLTQQLNQMNEINKHEISLSKKESDVLSNKCSILEQQVEDLRKENRTVNEQFGSVSKKVSTYQTKADLLNEKLIDAEADIIILNTHLDKTITDYHEVEQRLSHDKEERQNEIETLQCKIQSEQRDMKAHMKEKERNFKLQLSKEKRKSESYKEKAIDAHTKKLQVKRLLMQQDYQDK